MIQRTMQILRTKRCQSGICGLAIIPLLVVLVSCSNDDGLGKRYPVSGTVTYNGNPLEKGVISFIPEDPNGIGATGAIRQGSYTLSVAGESDGARPGKYKVTVTSKEDATARAQAEFEKARAARKDKSGVEEVTIVPKQFLTKAEASAKSLIPPGYSDPQSTNLKATVEEKANVLDFKLTDADAPPAPVESKTGRTGRHGKF